MIERREGEREKERERKREVKGAQSKPNPTHNAFPKLWDAHGSLFERKILGNYEWELSVDYQWELLLRIISGNYHRKPSISMTQKS